MAPAMPQMEGLPHGEGAPSSAVLCPVSVSHHALAKGGVAAPVSAARRVAAVVAMTMKAGPAGVNGGGVVTMAPVRQGMMAVAMHRHAMTPVRALVGHAVMARATVMGGHGRSGVVSMVTGPVRRARRRRLGVVMVAVDAGLGLAGDEQNRGQGQGGCEGGPEDGVHGLNSCFVVWLEQTRS